MGLVKSSTGMDRISPTFCRGGWDWSDFLEGWMGLVKPFEGVDGIGQMFCGSEWDCLYFPWGWRGCSNFLQEKADWSNFMQEGKRFSRWGSTNFLQE